MNQPPIVPAQFNLSALVQRSVATFGPHLVTRPTGQALRIGIEAQISEFGDFCVSVLDFSDVVVLDYSCADEVVAKLIQRYQRSDRPKDAYFVARGLQEEHRDQIEEVLSRHQLALVAEMNGAFALLGHASAYERDVWALLQQMCSAEPGEIASHTSSSETDATTALESLTERRTVLHPANGRRFFSLTALLKL